MRSWPMIVAVPTAALHPQMVGSMSIELVVIPADRSNCLGRVLAVSSDWLGLYGFVFVSGVVGASPGSELARPGSG